MDITAALAQAQRTEKVVQLCLRGDLRAQYEQYETELTAAEANIVYTESLNGGGRRRELAEQLESLRKQMLDESVEFRVRAVSRGAWAQMVSQHPKPDGGDGINVETFLPALLHACLIDPVLTGDQWVALEETLTSRQYETLTDAAWIVNRGDVSVPFSRAASRIVQSSESA